MTVIPVILSGGAGTRLWPVSRAAHPKPFMILPDGMSLLQKTLDRVARIPNIGHVLTITNRDYYFKTRDEYASLSCGQALDFDYILEPRGRNTGPALAVAALFLRERFGEEALMLALPADHLIKEQQAFESAVSAAVALAGEGSLVTFGITPTAPETGFGYIECGDALGGGRQVRRFVEKPSLEWAQEYLAAGNFLWNSGMFCFKVQSFLDAMSTHALEILDAVEACWRHTPHRETPMELDLAGFLKVPDISVDYAVMERAQNVVVVPADLGWSDIGSWTAVAELTPEDELGNRVQGEALLVESRDCYVYSEERLVAALGVSDLVIVDTPDALLVANKANAQGVKKIVAALKEADHEASHLHRTVHRPWGTYTVLEEGNRFKIKRLVVQAGQSLSLQMHYHRSEHWIVVQGTAKVIQGHTQQEHLVRTNESTYIPAGTPHRLENPGVVELVMIEVQSGEYLGEDDIVRFDDQYGRV